jgi:hypothetical protein
MSAGQPTDRELKILWLKSQHVLKLNPAEIRGVIELTQGLLLQVEDQQSQIDRLHKDLIKALEAAPKPKKSTRLTNKDATKEKEGSDAWS